MSRVLRAPVRKKVVAALKAAGYDPAECVMSSVPVSGEVVLGGGLDA